jgi:hypothetical protein
MRYLRDAPLAMKAGYDVDHCADGPLKSWGRCRERFAHQSLTDAGRGVSSRRTDTVDRTTDDCCAKRFAAERRVSR